MNIGEIIRNRREELGLTQEELSSKMKYKNKSIISKVENSNSCNFTRKTLEKYAKALDVPVEYFTYMKNGIDISKNGSSKIFTGKTTSNDVKRLLENSTEVIGIDSDDNVIELTKRDSREIEEILNKTKEMLSQEGLLFDGEPASEESIESILSAMEMGMALAKQKNKEKYTPNKYKKD